MIRNRKTSSPSLRFSCQRSLLLGLGLATSLGFWGNGSALAQTASSAEAVPAAKDLLAQPVPSGSTASASQPEATPIKASPAPEAAPIVVPESMTRPAPQGEAADAAAPAGDRPRSIPTLRRSPAATPAAEASPAAPSGNNAVPVLPNSSEAYIDPTRYQLGATESSAPQVVLSERSSGCEVVLQRGAGVPSSVCIPPAAQGSALAGAAAAAQPGADGSVGVGAMRLSQRGVGFAPGSVQSFFYRTLRPNPLPGNGNSRLMFPLSIPTAITSVFGWRIHPVSGDSRFHYGTDLGAPMGTPVLAAYSGRVTTADFLRGYGLTVVLHHNRDTEQTLYAHMSEVFVQPGQWVEQGEVIGRVGSTGLSTGPHLHFEFRERTEQGWVALDPGLALQTALVNFVNNFQLAQALPQSKADQAPAVKGLQDFGRFASDAKPEVQTTAQAPAAPAK